MHHDNSIKMYLFCHFSIPDSGIGSLSSDHVAEINGDTLYLIGTGVLSSLEKNYGIQAAGAVICISFKFIDFDQISNYLPRIRTRFPSVYVSSMKLI